MLECRGKAGRRRDRGNRAEGDQYLLNAEHQPCCHACVNPDWALGMYTFIACGMIALLDQSTDFDADLITTVNQSRIDALFLRKLIDAQQGQGATGLAYPSEPGIPACFGAARPVGLRLSLFDRLLNLTTQGGGAKAIPYKIPDIKKAESEQTISVF